MTKDEAIKRTLQVAAMSTAHKRKVGAVIFRIIDNDYLELSLGFNHNSNGIDFPCEDLMGNTLPEVVHAEIMAIKEMPCDDDIWHDVMFVTHQPCVNCATALVEADIPYEVISDFMKFDTSKLRYDLIPPSALKALASVLTYGAKKYKPNNWKNVDDTERYTAALFRHLEAWRSGEYNDPESGQPHLAHMLTNVAFLLELKATGKWNKGE